MTDIALMGLACRFPGAENAQAFWSLLARGEEAITEIPPERWPLSRYYDPDPERPGKMDTRRAGLIKNIDQFDAGFFNISPREAVHLDPQQRLLLQTTWEALEDAGLTAWSKRPTGVYVGISGNEYGIMETRDLRAIDAYTLTGTGLCLAANRISYAFDLSGPSLALDTACSSSLVALHLACRALEHGEIDLAIVGGANIILDPAMSISIAKLRATAPDGRSKAFDASANGYVRGEGVAVVVLSRLQDALRNQDRVRSVIKGTGVNQDGRSNGLTAPNGAAQAALLEQVLAHANIAPQTIGYVEAHGTGTFLGDPIEARALGQIIGQKRATPLSIGSVKTNIGHLEACAGLASVIKVTLSLEQQQLPPSLHFHTPNPHIPFAELNLAVQTKLTAWTEDRRAGVSSFGVGGTNAHAILEAAPPAPPASIFKDVPLILPLSAKNKEALDALATKWVACDTISVAAQATRKTAHEHRWACVATDSESVKERLAQRPDAEQSYEGRAQKQRLAFVYTGQGAQWAKMGLGLEAPAFREALVEVDAALAPHLGASIIEVIGHDSLESTQWAQPAIFALQVALTRLWAHWGVAPDWVIGHSVGELAAAHAAGTLGLQEAARLVAERGRLMQAATGRGRMVVVDLTENEALKFVRDHTSVSVAALNGPRATVLAGPTAAVEAAITQLEANGVLCRRMKVDYAFHCALVEPAAQTLAQRAQLTPLPARIPWISTVTGKEGAYPSAEYWGQNVRSPVRFSNSISRALELGASIFVEVGPHPALMQDILTVARGLRPVKVACSLRRGRSEIEAMAESLASLWVSGVPVDFGGYYGGRPVARLPSYPWQNQSFWLPAPESVATEPEGAHPLLGTRVQTSLPEAIFARTISAARLPLLADHRIYGKIVLPAVAYVEMAVAAGRALLASETIAIDHLEIREPLVLGEQETRLLELVAAPESAGKRAFRISSKVEGQWRLHAIGHLGVGTVSEAVSFPELPQASPVELYQGLEKLGFGHGPRFRGLQGLSRGSGAAVGEVRAEADEGFQLHPASLEAALQVLGATLSEADYADADEVHLPVVLEHVVARATPARSWATLERRDDRGFSGRVVWHDADGAWGGEVRGLTVRRAPKAALMAAVGVQALYHSFELQTVSETVAVPPTERIRLGQAVAASGPLLVVDATQIESLQVGLDAAQALLRGSRPFLWVTQGVLRPPYQPHHWAIWGLLRAALAEGSKNVAGLIDQADGPLEPLLAVPQAFWREGLTWQGGPKLQRLTSAPRPTQPLLLSGVQLITGGLGGLGLVLAERLAAQGWVVVVWSRTAPSPQLAQRLEQQRIRWQSVDVSNFEAVESALENVRTLGPLGGVFHLAGVAADGLVDQLTPQLWRTALDAKVNGALHLDRLTSNDPLTCFVLFSSLAAVMGAPGQGAYAAANAYLSGLAEVRAATGRPALAVELGPIAEVGMAKAAAVQDRLRRNGLIPVAAGRAIDAVLAAGGTPRIIIAELSAPQAEAPQLIDALRGVPPAERHERMVDSLAAVLATVLGVKDPHQLDPARGFFELGLDSLMALELRERLSRATGQDFSPTLVFDHPNLNALSKYLEQQLFPPTPDALEQLSEAELLALLEAELEPNP